MKVEQMDVELLQYFTEDGEQKANSVMIFEKWERNEIFEFISNTLFAGAEIIVEQEIEKGISLQLSTGVSLLLVEASIVEGLVQREDSEAEEDNDIMYIHVHPEGRYLVCNFDEPNPDLDRPTFKQAMRLTPNYISYARKGNTLIFEDMTIEIKENLKHSFTDDAQIDAYHDDMVKAEDNFQEWLRMLGRMDNEERIRFLAMVYNDRFNAGKPLNIDE